MLVASLKGLFTKHITKLFKIGQSIFKTDYFKRYVFFFKYGFKSQISIFLDFEVFIEYRYLFEALLIID